MIVIKRIYENYDKSDGYRVLVDRLWTRGISQEKAHIDEWLKEIAPSNTLRKWFNHDSTKWEEFKKKYIQELTDKKDLLDNVKDLEKKHNKVTLLYAAKDTVHNQAIVLLRLLS